MGSELKEYTRAIATFTGSSDRTLVTISRDRTELFRCRRHQTDQRIGENRADCAMAVAPAVLADRTRGDGDAGDQGDQDAVPGPGESAPIGPHDDCAGGCRAGVERLQ